MTLDDILEEWRKDSPIDQLNLIGELANVPKLHHKYLNYLKTDKLMYKKEEIELKKLKFEKYEHYTNPTKESMKKWTLPPRGAIIHKDTAKDYVDVDDDVTNKQLKIHYIEEKVLALESILKQIHGRSFIINGMINYRKFLEGV